MNKPTNRLYYYCKLATAIEKILPSKELLLNPIGRTNDPRENKSFVFALLNRYPPDFSLFKNPNEEISKEIRKNCKMLCFSTDYEDLFGYEYSRMWALYGENHTGVCLELDKEKFLSENISRIQPNQFKNIEYIEFKVTEPQRHKEIDYSRINKVGLKKYIEREFRPKNIDYLFFTKNKEWESEHECRLLYISEDEDPEYCTFFSCLKSIYLGIDFNLNYLPSIVKKFPNTSIYKLDYKGVRLVPLEINNNIS